MITIMAKTVIILILCIAAHTPFSTSLSHRSLLLVPMDSHAIAVPLSLLLFCLFLLFTVYGCVNCTAHSSFPSSSPLYSPLYSAYFGIPTFLAATVFRSLVFLVFLMFLVFLAFLVFAVFLHVLIRLLSMWSILTFISSFRWIWVSCSLLRFSTLFFFPSILRSAVVYFVKITVLDVYDVLLPLVVQCLVPPLYIVLIVLVFLFSFNCFSYSQFLLLLLSLL